MNSKLLFLLALTFVTEPSSLHAQSTAFTYQGRLDSSGSPSTGGYDLRVAVFDAADGGNLRGLLTNSAVAVSNGLFTTTLDFGFGVFNGGPRWLEIGVRSNGTATAFNTLAPRQAVLPAPYAFWSANASQAVTVTGTVPASGLNGLYLNPVNFSNPGNSFIGGFAGDGTGLNNVNAAQLGGRSAGQFWQTGGNAGTSPATDFLGTTDNQPLELRVNGQRALRLEPKTNGAPNLIGGSPWNFVASGVKGATVAGGGSTNVNGLGVTNRVAGDFGTVGGGGGNQAQGTISTVAGGWFNLASGYISTVGGGQLNIASGDNSVVVGGARNTASGFAATAMGLYNTASGYAATALGSSTAATSNDSTAMGRLTLAGGSASTAMGYRAKAQHNGAFVWADSQEADFSSTGTNQFLIRATGGVGINTNHPNGAALAVNGNVTISGTVNGTFTGSGAGLTDVNLALNSGGAFSLSGNFALGSSPGVGSGPLSITAADVNGDGHPDLISANAIANTLTVLTNTGSGDFALSSSPGVGNGPLSITAVDVNGDGNVDLISANYSANTLTVVTNTGAGGFTLASSPSMGGLPQWVTAADVNGDGQPDLIGANNGANTLTVVTNTGSGGFVLASSLVVGDGPLSVAAADVNRDGRPDLISANNGDSTLTVLTNNGGGGFVLSSSPGLGSQPLSVTTADVNGDGQPDLISEDYGDNTLTVLTNNGSGGFVLSSLPGVGLGPYSVIAVDVNGDGRPDLISANAGDSTLTVLFNAATFTGRFAGDGTGLTSVPAGSLTGKIAETRLSANVALLNVSQLFTEPNFFNSGVYLNPPASLSFGSQARQMINLWGSEYAIGVQSDATYFRTGNEFMWYRGGSHSDAFGDPGSGGTQLMRLGSTGNLIIAGTLSPSSDRNVKNDFAAVDAQEVLAKVAALSIQTWTYTNNAGVRHLGPVAQDFHAAFGLNGEDDKHIATVDADGVALAAIQGLNQKVEEQGAALKSKDARIAELEKRLSAIESLLQK